MKPDLHPDRLLDRREVHAIYGVPVRYLEVAATRGEGPPIVRVGRLCRYRISDLLDWLERRTEGRPDRPSDRGPDMKAKPAALAASANAPTHLDRRSGR